MTEPLYPSGTEQAARPRSSTAGRRWAGLVVGVVVLVVVAVPAYWTALFAYSGFSGCFLECTRPQPLVGVVWTGMTVVLLGCPVAAGLMTARVQGRRAWTIALCVAVLLMGALGLAQLVA